MKNQNKQVLTEVRTELDKRATLPKARVARVMQAVQTSLPKAGDLASGVLVVWIKNASLGEAVGIATCTGGHLCDTQDSTPGDGPDCEVEACNTETCRDGHECSNQSCGAEACDDQHSCTGNYKGVLDSGTLRASSRKAWNTLQQTIDDLKAQDKLDVLIMTTEG